LSKNVARRGTAYLLLPLSSGGASPLLRFPIGGFRHFPMTDPIASRQRLPGGTHRETPPLHGACQHASFTKCQRTATKNGHWDL